MPLAYTLPIELTQALSSAMQKGLELANILEHSNGEVEEIDHAYVQLLTESTTLAIAAVELLKNHYAFPAEVLLRAIADRVSTVHYIALNGEKGFKNWKSNKLPSLTERVGNVFGFSESESQGLAQHIKALHKTVHGDFKRAVVNQGLESGKVKYWLGQNPTRPEQSESIAMLLVSELTIIDFYLAQLIEKIIK